MQILSLSHGGIEVVFKRLSIQYINFIYKEKENRDENILKIREGVQINIYRCHAQIQQVTYAQIIVMMQCI